MKRIEAGLRIKPLIAGDINTDGKVDEYDLEILAAAFGSTPNDPKWNPSADINGNNIVDAHDLYVLAANYGKP